MMDEKELRRQFAQLREADLEGAPKFAETVAGERDPHGPIAAAKRARRSRHTTLRLRPLAIGAAAAVLTAVVLLARGRSFSPSASTPAITTWTAPTDVFLRTPGNELLGAMPALGASVLDTMIPTPTIKGT